MNPTLILLCGVAQLALLYNQSPWIEGAGVGACVLAIVAIFAYTRLHWDTHVDMFLAMTGPGGLGMILGALITGQSCHDVGWNWASFALMSLGMAVASMPLCWFRARCLLEAREQGRGVQALVLDWVGMQAGMMLGHLPATLVHLSDTRAVWLHHGIILVAMSLGMLAAAVLQASLKPAVVGIPNRT